MSMLKDIAKRNVEELLKHSDITTCSVELNWVKGVAKVEIGFELTPEQIESRKLKVTKDA